MNEAEHRLLAEVEDGSNTRDVIAYEYGWLLYSGREVDWSRIDRAISDRWSESGLRYIKRRAWAIVKEQHH